MASKRNLRKKIEFLDLEENEESGFIEGDVVTGKVISSFNFISEPASTAVPAATKAFIFNSEKPAANALTDNIKIKTAASIAAPLVEGESYNIGRFYKLRYSTAKMLNEIKAAHPDVNVYMNTLVDEAIRYYYSFVFKEDRR